MRPLCLATLAAATLAAAPTVAEARPITAGVGLGLTQSKDSAATDPNHTLGVFGRVGLTPRLSAQLDLARLESDDQNVTLRTGTALLVLDFGGDGHLVPVLLAGLGLDSASYSYGGDTSASHVEAGLGLEYRLDGGLTLGADVRVGSRSVDPMPATAYPTGGALYYAPSTLRDGEYRSARLTAGIRF